MSTNMLQTIVQNLNAPPFNRNITMITFDSMSPEKLLQTLSDVIFWIQDIAEIDIRGETPDETAMRILNALRMFRYPPPKDIDQIQNWRLDILEGNKQAIYPVLEWIFINVDRLKERVYLANYLTKIEIPPEEQNPDLAKVSAAIDQKMEEFKTIHSRIVEIRGNYTQAEDVRSDLRTMEDEKEHLIRKIDRSKTRLSQRPDIEKYLEFAAQHRRELEQQQELQNQRQEQRNTLILVDQRMNRLQRMMAEVEKESDSIDPHKFLEKYKNEAETNRYLVEEKLPKEIGALKSSIENVHKILAMKTVSQQDIDRLKQKIDQLNREVMEITMRRDKQDESNEDQLGIYRHQAAGVQRKKSTLADQLQTTRQQYEYLEGKIAQKKRELGLKKGVEELVTTVQYKNYLNKMRVKTNLYKKKKLEMDQLSGEVSILQSTKSILQGNWELLKTEIQKEGRGIIEESGSVVQRPKTAKPQNTDTTELKSMVKKLSDQLVIKRNAVEKLNEEIHELSSIHKKENEEYLANQTQINSMRAEMEREHKNEKEHVEDLETQLKNTEDRIEKLQSDLNMHQFFAESIDQPDRTDSVVARLEKDSQECRLNIDRIHSQLKELSQRSGTSEQIIMWRSLIQIFEKKIELIRRRSGKDGQPIGDF